jgi:hypothetical protein
MLRKKGDGEDEEEAQDDVQNRATLRRAEHQPMTDQVFTFVRAKA